MSEAVNSDATRVEIRAVRASKWYGRVTALQEVSLQLEPGVWGLLGPNGSGKTTFLNMVAGQLRPSLGDIRVAGESPFNNPNVLRRIGYCPEADALYDQTTALEFVSSMGELSGLSSRDARTRAEEVLDTFGLRDAMHRRLGGYSRGMRQRAKLAQAIVHNPDVLLLDEPLTGTDPVSRQFILDEMRTRASKGALVLFSTHVLHEVEALTNQVLLIARGQVVAQGDAQEFRDLLDEYPLRIHVSCDEPRRFAADLLLVPSVSSVGFLDSSTLEVAATKPDEAYQAICDAALRSDVELKSITSPDANLETLFHHLVDRASSMAGTGADAGSGRRRA